MNDDQSKTQSLIIQLTSELKSYKTGNDVIISQLTKMQEAHSKELWGTDDDNPGIKAKVKTLMDSRQEEVDSRTWWRAALGIPVVGLCLNWVVEHFIKN